MDANASRTRDRSLQGKEARHMQRSASRFGLDVARKFRRWVLAESPAPKRSIERRCGWGAMLLVFVALRGASAAELDHVLLDFTAKWCGPCQQMSSTVSKLERQGLPIRKVDIDQEPALASRFSVKSIPCFVLVSNGREIDRVTGLTDEKQLRSMLNKLPKSDAVASAPNDGPRGGNGSSGAGLGPGVGIGSLGSPEGKISPIGLPPIFGGQNKAGGQYKAKDARVVPALQDETAIVRGQNGEDAAGPVDPLFASVRLRVQDGSGINFGSGTIIDSRPGRAVILTCGHIFRKGGNDSKVEVDLFRPASNAKLKGKVETLEGKVLHFDLDADVGLVTIVQSLRLPTVRLGSSRELTVKDRVQSIGCSGGDDPTREDQLLTALNKYDGPDNIECSTMPQQGRSGGGLFLGNELIGVCIAADPREKRGIYAAMKPIALLLDKVGLGHLAPLPLAVEGTLAKTNTPAAAASAESRTAAATASPFGRGLATDRASATVTAADDITRFLASELGAAGSGLTEPAVAPQDYEGAEIICIVRSKTPGLPSRVVIVNQASGRFVGDLLHESQTPADRTVTRRAEWSDDHEVAPQQAVAQQRVRRPSPLENRVAVATPVTAQETSRPVETSFEPQPYRRQRD